MTPFYTATSTIVSVHFTPKTQRPLWVTQTRTMETTPNSISRVMWHMQRLPKTKCAYAFSLCYFKSLQLSIQASLTRYTLVCLSSNVKLLKESQKVGFSKLVWTVDFSKNRCSPGGLLGLKGCKARQTMQMWWGFACSSTPHISRILSSNSFWKLK